MNENLFKFIGNVTKDLVLKNTPSNKPTVTFTLAVDASYVDKGVLVKKTDWLPITTYGELAELNNVMLKQGTSVEVKGSVHSWYSESLGRGGFNFVATHVRPLKRFNESPVPQAPTDHQSNPDAAAGDDWTKAYDSVPQQ